MGCGQLLLVILQITSSLSIFGRWYIPQNNPFERSPGHKGGWSGGWGSLSSRQLRKRAGPVNAGFAEGDDAGQIRQRVWPIKDCMTVSHSQTGLFTFNSGDLQGVCGLYLVGRPNEKIVVSLESADLSGDCAEDILVLVDGWELNGNVVPSDEDHPLPIKKRFTELCRGEDAGTQLVSSQNAAMVQFKVGNPGSRFTVSVKYIPNPDPCNVLMSEMTGVFKISNHGQERNCSVTTLLFPAKISLLEVNVGSRFVKRSSSSASSRLQRRGFVGLVPQCSEMGEKDFLELGGSTDLNTNLQTSSTLCGFQPKPSDKDLTILCGSSTLRLVSSGEFRNSVTALVQEATLDDLDTNKNIIMACPSQA